MNRELQKLIENKWVLLAADFIAVLGVLLIGLNPRDGFEGFLAVTGILGASLIVVVPILKEGGGKRERLAEQARLRAALAEEIDRMRDDFRASIESVNRRVVEVELASRKNSEAALAALAQKASAEINTLKAAVAELEKKVQAGAQSAAQAAEVKEAVEELGSRVEELAKAVRGAVADAEEVAESANVARTEAAAEFKAVREELKKSGQRADKAVAAVESALESVRAEVRELRANPPVVSAPSQASVQDEEPETAVLKAAPSPVVPEAQIAAEIEEEEEIVEDEEESDDDADEDGDDEEEAVSAPVSSPEEAGASGVGTALIVNLMIGIGNKPFVRGTGPGLSRDKGVPMTFLGIGRWQWVSPEPDAPATVEVWKNDQTPLGEPLHLSGGEPVEVDEAHFNGA